MQEDLKELILQYQRQKISNEEFISKLSFDRTHKDSFIRNIFKDIIQSKNAESVDYGLTLLWILEKDDEFIDIVHQLILESWHGQYENIAHELQRRSNKLSIPFLKLAMQKKYDFLESYGSGTRQFINQCGHALRSIGTEDALDVIKELSKSNDPVLRDEMLYRISKIEGSNDYERDYDL
jgi:hypothetical protein